jgi:hypothetical protein
MTPEESEMLAEFVRAEMSDGEAFVRRSALVSLAARWRVEAARLENSMAERANALRECAAALEAEMASSKANGRVSDGSYGNGDG